MTAEMIDKHFIKILNAIMDFDENKQSDNDFIEIIKLVCSGFIGETIDELKEGFLNELPDVIVFFRENLKTLVEIGVGEELRMMISAMGNNVIMTYITKAYKFY